MLPPAPTASPAPAPSFLPEPTLAPTLAPAPAATPPASSALGQRILPDIWLLAGGIGALLALLLGGWLLLRRRKPAPLRLAAPAPAPAGNSAPASDAAAAPLRLDMQFDIVAATRSVMMFSIDYRLELANRTDRGINNVQLAARLACARRGEANTAPAGAAQDLHDIARIGAQQSRSITGTLRLPLADIAVLRQGRTPLFVPLVHLTISGEGMAPVTRSYVVGLPSATSLGRVHPIALDTPPGGIANLRAQLIELPDRAKS